MKWPVHSDFSYCPIIRTSTPCLVSIWKIGLVKLRCLWMKAPFSISGGKRKESHKRIFFSNGVRQFISTSKVCFSEFCSSIYVVLTFLGKRSLNLGKEKTYSIKLKGRMTNGGQIVLFHLKSWFSELSVVLFKIICPFGGKQIPFF